MGIDDISRIYIGNLPSDCSQKELEEEFEKFGRILYCDLKRSYTGSSFAFIEFSDSRDARDAIRDKDGFEFHGKKLRVELPFRERDQASGGSRRHGPRRGKYVLEVTGLPPSGSWQDLKDHMRDAGHCGHADVFRGGVGEISFFSRSDMEYAIEKYDGSTFKSHEGEKSRISVREKRRRRRSSSYRRRARSYSRSKSKSRSYSASPKYRSRTRSRSRERSRSRTRSRSEARSVSERSQTRSRSRSDSKGHSPERSEERKK
ncbi:splicing factor [Theileria orientalis strain Shintoku]|uniref:Splicing factor n=1 Tax=Theileria orientalis strain Shintoku TaxID=869250 RepID=J4DQC5_THEOR|nr:splicing factor [Theileria orientalis strain Shintoku]PVC54666.1 splicing factor [Theileria orientalis]BAM42214.1 splicing factor [Theileria orientalis strain Shintoku]|eukprot:XP_009692515.1 splicing factor [Theileria orientalis strain Shintoku]